MLLRLRTSMRRCTTCRRWLFSNTWSQNTAAGREEGEEQEQEARTLPPAGGAERQRAQGALPSFSLAGSQGPSSQQESTASCKSSWQEGKGGQAAGAHRWACRGG